MFKITRTNWCSLTPPYFTNEVCPLVAICVSKTCFTSECVLGSQVPQVNFTTSGFVTCLLSASSSATFLSLSLPQYSNIEWISTVSAVLTSVVNFKYLLTFETNYSTSLQFTDSNEYLHRYSVTNYCKYDCTNYSNTVFSAFYCCADYSDSVIQVLNLPVVVLQVVVRYIIYYM